MANDIQFGSFPLNATTGVSVHVIREKSPAERSIGLIQPARSRGVDIVSITEKSKIVEIQGYISSDKIGATYTGIIRDFVTAIKKRDNLYISTSDGLFFYEDCVLLNTENSLRQEDHYNINFMPFTLQFLAPKGVALAANLTRSGVAYHGINTSPYTNEIQIQGTAQPEPVITLSVDSVGSGLSNLAFFNRDTNEIISVATTYENDDIVVIDTKGKRVTMNAIPKNFSGIFPRFRTGENRFQITAEASSTIHASQTSFDSESAVFGSKRLSQSITPSTNVSISQIEILMRKEEQSLDTEVLLDDFQDSILSSEWSTSGAVTESGGVLNIGDGTNASDGTAQTTTTSAKGWLWRWSVAQRGSSGNSETFTEVTSADNTQKITFLHAADVNQIYVSTTGFAGQGTSRINASGGDLKVLQEGSDINVYLNDVRILQILNTTMPSMTVRTKVYSGTNQTVSIDNVKYITEVNATVNSDITIEIQTDSAGSPSGTPVTNASTTIKKADIPSNQFVYMPAIFATAPSLTSSTVYHIVVYQSGGDQKNYYTVKINNDGGYSSGNIETSNNSGTTWAEQTSDMAFKLYGTFPTGWSIDADIDYAITHHSIG